MFKPLRLVLPIGWVLSALLLVGCAQKNLQSSVSVTAETGRPQFIVWPNANSHSNNEVSIRLVVQAGSLQETDQQRGYAHFVEHMVFRGTENFPDKTLQARLRDLGVDIGQHSNAYTSFNETVYWVHLNTADQDRIDGVLEVLADMAFKATFDPAVVEIEKSVVVQEWRDRTREESSVDELLNGHFYQGSQYAERYPIGTKESIEAATAESLKAFYEAWYHTGNISVIVAGDVDLAATQQTLQRVFPMDALRASGGQPERTALNLSAINPRFMMTDSLTTAGSVWISYLHPQEVPTTKPEGVRELAYWVAMDVLNDRLSNRILDLGGRVTGFDAFSHYPVPGYFAIELGAYFQSEHMQEAVTVLEEERQRLLTEGVTAAELQRWKTNFLRSERRQQDSADHLADEAMYHVLENWPMLNQPEKLALWEELLPQVTPAEILHVLRPTLTQAPIVALVHPNNIAAPEAADIDAWLAAARFVPSAQPTTDAGNEWSINPTYQGAIELEEDLGHGLTRWQLDNGIEVFHKFSDVNPNKVNFTMVGLGGFNRLAEEDIPAGRLLVDMLANSGLRDLDGPQLNQWLQDQNLALDIRQDFFDKALYGSSETDNLDMALRVVHSALTEARIDPRVWEYFHQQYREQLQQLATHPHKPWIDMANREMHGNDAALRPLTQQELDQITQAQVMDVYQRTVAGAQNYRLSIVGDISREDARRAVLESIATLTPQAEEILVGRPVPRVQTSSDERVTGSGEQSAQIVMRYNLPKANLASTYGSDSYYLSRWLNERLFDRLRNELGQVYSINVQLDGNTERHTDVTLVINLAVDPEEVDHAIEEVRATLAATHGTLDPEELSRWHSEGRDGLKNEQLSPHVLASDIAYAELFDYDVVRLVTADPREPTADNVEGLLAMFLYSDTIPQTWVWLP